MPSAGPPRVADRGRLLLDRAEDLAELSAALAEVLDGDGQLVVIDGPAGIGKSHLLDELRRRARDHELQVASARGGELELEYGFGIVRQLFEPLLLGSSDSDREQLLSGAARLAAPVFRADPDPAEHPGDVSFARLHGLHWLVANLAERAPLLIALDDVHWADEPSLRFVDHLARRLAGMPVLIALCTRTGAEADRPLLRSLVVEARSPILRPRPLGGAAVRTLVRSRLDPAAGDELCRACHDASRGNPFLLTELLAELRLADRPLDELDPAAVHELAPGRVGAAVLIRVGGLDPDAPALARAVSVLGEEATYGAVARLAGLEPARCATLADSLVDVDVLDPGEPLRFVHPLVRSAIYNDIPTVRRSGLHALAAQVLINRQGPPEAVAMHLLATHPGGRPEVVKALREAAHRAVESGAPDTARAMLQRALAEPPDERLRPQVLLELGKAESLLGLPSTDGHLREAYDTSVDPVVRSRALITLGYHTWSREGAPRLRPLVGEYERTAADVRPHDEQLAIELEAVRLGALLLNPALPVRFEDEVDRFRDLPMQSASECTVHSFRARRELARGNLAAAGDIAEHLVAHPAVNGSAGWARVNTTFCLVATEHYDVAERELTRLFRRGEQQGLPALLTIAGWQRALVRHRRGDLPGAEADGRAASAVRVQMYGPDARSSPTVSPWVEALTDQGKIAEADALVSDHHLDREVGTTLTTIGPLIARGRFRAAAGDLAGACNDLTEALRRMHAARGLYPGEHDARVALVPVLLALGDTEQARALAAESIAAARAAGTPRALGGALRVAGLARGGKAGLELLREAVDTLAESPSLLWRAEALVDYGSALRLDGQRSASRDVLLEGLDLAHRCGATPLADRAAEALRALGARVRRRAITGAESLTTSERRVAELAAEGMPNKQIAQTLFVTLRTVEAHLSNSYTKLQITSRDQLAQALEGRR